MAKIIATEHEEQKAFIEYCNLQGGDWLRFYAIPNGGDRHPAVAAKLKAEGVRKGVLDLCLPVARGGYHGLYIEMKRRKGGKLSDDQANEQVKLRQAGYCAEVAKGWEEAVNITKDYLCSTSDYVRHENLLIGERNEKIKRPY